MLKAHDAALATVMGFSQHRLNARCNSSAALIAEAGSVTAALRFDDKLRLSIQSNRDSGRVQRAEKWPKSLASMLRKKAAPLLHSGAILQSVFSTNPKGVPIMHEVQSQCKRVHHLVVLDDGKGLPWEIRVSGHGHVDLHLTVTPPVACEQRNAPFKQAQDSVEFYPRSFGGAHSDIDMRDIRVSDR